MRITTSPAPWHVWMVVAAMVAAWSCSSMPRMSSSMRQVESIQVGTLQLRSLVHEYGARFAAETEHTADEITAETSDPEVYGALLRWKIEGITAIHRAVFRHDPFVALIDAWALTIQLRHRAESPAGAAQLKEFAPRVVNTLRDLEQDLAEIADFAGGETLRTEAAERIEAWARENPIDSHHLARESIALLAANVDQDRLTPMSAVVSISHGIDDLNARITAYEAYTPKKIQWMIELLLLEELGSADLGPLIDDLHEVLELLHTATELGERTVKLVPEEREIILDRLTAERRVILAEVDQRWQVIFTDIDRLRGDIAQDVDSQVSELVLQAGVLRSDSLDELDALTAARLDQLTAEVEASANRIIDRLYWLVALILGGLAAIVILGAVLARARGGRSHG